MNKSAINRKNLIRIINQSTDSTLEQYGLRVMSRGLIKVLLNTINSNYVLSRNYPYIIVQIAMDLHVTCQAYLAYPFNEHRA